MEPQTKLTHTHTLQNLDQLLSAIHEQEKEEMFISMFYGI